MADEETPKPLPPIALPTLITLIGRMGEEGIPDRVDKRYLAGMAHGTQFQYRQAFRALGLTADDDRPTSLLTDLVEASPDDRPELFGMIMSDRYPDLTGLPLDASKVDFFRVLRDQYDVKSDVQGRKMLTFFVHAADYAGLPIGPGLRPTKAGTGSRKSRASRRRTSARASRSAKGTVHIPDDGPAERRDISLGDAGSVSVVVNVRWLDLSEDQFTKLRKLIKDIEALGDSGI
jgi:hypothetical protein